MTKVEEDGAPDGSRTSAQPITDVDGAREPTTLPEVRDPSAPGALKRLDDSRVQSCSWASGANPPASAEVRGAPAQPPDATVALAAAAPSSAGAAGVRWAASVLPNRVASPPRVQLTPRRALARPAAVPNRTLGTGPGSKQSSTRDPSGDTTGPARSSRPMLTPRDSRATPEPFARSVPSRQRQIPAAPQSGPGPSAEGRIPARRGPGKKAERPSAPPMSAHPRPEEVLAAETLARIATQSPLDATDPGLVGHVLLPITRSLLRLGTNPRCGWGPGPGELRARECLTHSCTPGPRWTPFWTRSGQSQSSLSSAPSCAVHAVHSRSHGASPPRRCAPAP